MPKDPTLDEAVTRFCEAAAIPERLPDAMDLVARAVGARGAMLATPILTPAMMPISNGLNESSGAFFEEGWHRDALRTERGALFARRNRARFMRDQDLFSEREIETLPYYRDFARKFDVPWFAAAALVVRGSHYVALSFNRRGREGAFTREQVARLDRVLPRLQHMSVLCMETLDARAKGVLWGFDRTRTPALLIDWSGRVCGFNEETDALLGRGLEIKGCRLTLGNRGEQLRLDDLLRLAISPDADTGGVLPVPITLGQDARYLVHAVPITGTAHDVFRQAAALILLDRVNATAPKQPAVLRSLFPFTAREAEIAALLADGLSVSAIAADLNLSAETARFYVKAVLDKSGTHRQAEFVRLAARLMVVVP